MNQLLRITFSAFAFLAFTVPSTSQAQSSPTQKSIGFIPNEAHQLDWVRDVGVGRTEVTKCEPQNESARWFDVCQRLLASRSNLTSLLIEENSARTKKIEEAPVVLLSTASQTLLTTFVPLEVSGFSNEKSNTLTVKLERDFKEKQIKCYLSDSKAKKNIIKKSWTLTRSEGENFSHFVLEQDSLAFAQLKGFSKVTCQIVVFDALNFKRFSNSLLLTYSELAAEFSILPIPLSKEQLQNANLTNWIGAAQPGERFRCEQIEKNSSLPNLCSVFDLNSGEVLKTSALPDFSKRMETIGDTFLTLNISKARNGFNTEKTTLKFLLKDFNPKEELATLSLSFQSHALAQTLVCDFAESKVFNRPSIVWKLNGKILNGWSNLWLLPQFLHFGNTYSCEVDGKKSPEVLVDQKFLKILAPENVLFPKDKSSLQFLVDLNMSLGALPAKWTCSSEQELECMIGGSQNSSRKIVVVRWKNDSLPTKGAKVQLSLHLDSKVSTLPVTHTVKLLSIGQLQESSIDISKDVSVVQRDADSFLCAIQNNSFAKFLTYSWFVNGKMQRDQQSSVFVDERKLMPGDLVSCHVKAHMNGTLYAGLSNAKAAPPAPHLESIPDTLVIDLAKPRSTSFSYFDQGQQDLSVECAVFDTKTNVQISENLCSYHTSLPSKQLTPEERTIFFQTRRSDLKQLENTVEFSSAKDPFYLTGFELRVQLFNNQRVYSKNIRVQLIRPNSRPEINLALNYLGPNGTNHCMALVSDANNNHLTTIINWGLLQNDRQIFSTFKRQTNRTFTEVSLPSVSQKYLLAVAEAPETAESKHCQVQVSDGTLIYKKISTGVESRAAAQSLLETFLRNLPASTAEQSKETVPPQPLTEFKEPVAKEVKYLLRSLNITSPGRITLEGIENITQLVSCDASPEICRQFFVSNGSLRFAATTDIPSTSVTLALRSKAEILLFTLNIYSEIFLGTGGHKLDNCLSYIEMRGKNQLPYWIDLALSAKFDQQGVEIPIPFYYVSRAIMSGATDIICTVKLSSLGGQSLSIRSVSLKSSLGLEKLLNKEGKNVFTNFYAKNGILNPLQHLALSRPLSEHFPSWLLSNVKMDRCTVTDESGTKACNYDANSLLIKMPSTSESPVFDFTVRFEILGVSIKRSFSVQLFSPLARFTGGVLGAKILPDPTAENSFRCAILPHSKGSTYSFKYGFKSNNETVKQIRSFESETSFASPHQQTKAVACDVETDLGYESTRFASGSENLPVQDKCVALSTSGKIEMFSCEINNFSQELQLGQIRSLEPEFGEKIKGYEAIKVYRHTEDNFFLQSTTVRAEPLASTTHQQSTFKTNNFLFVDRMFGRTICFHVFDGFKQEASLLKKPQLDNLGCGTFQLLSSGLQKNTRFSDVYFEGENFNAGQVGETFDPKNFLPTDADLFVGAPDFRSFYTQRWLDSLQRFSLFQKPASIEVFCVAGGQTSNNCSESARALYQSLEKSSKLVSTKITRLADVNESGRQSSALMARIVWKSSGHEYTSTLAEFL